MVGHFLESSPDLVKQMVADGHTVGNHTYHHPDMSAISDQASFGKEIGDVEAKYKEITGQEMTKYYRPPQGKYSTENLKMAQDLGYHTFFWSLAYVDWYADNQPTPEQAHREAARTDPSGGDRFAPQYIRYQRKYLRRTADEMGEYGLSFWNALRSVGKWK